MNFENIKSVIERVFDNNEDVNPNTSGEVRDAIELALKYLDSGELRVAEPIGNSQWKVNQWLKKAVLLSFKINDMDVISGGPKSLNNSPSNWWDKIPSKFSGWDKNEFKAAGFRAVPGSVVRYSAFIAPSVVLMPSFVNIGAYVDSGSMIDTWATVGSCAQIGKNVHLSGGVGIGGVLEPIQAAPVIIEDNVFVGSRSIVVEGVRIEQEAVLGANVVLTASTKIIDVSGDKPIEHKGIIPSRSVVIPGSVKKDFPAGEFSVPCALIIGKRKESTDKKTSLNDALRTYNVAV